MLKPEAVRGVWKLWHARAEADAPDVDCSQQQQQQQQCLICASSMRD